jgi:hypothetical protein
MAHIATHSPGMASASPAQQDGGSGTAGVLAGFVALALAIIAVFLFAGYQGYLMTQTPPPFTY